MAPTMTSHPPFSWLQLPRRTARLRLTLFYGGLFLVSGVVLLAITNVLVRSTTGNFVFFQMSGKGLPLSKELSSSQGHFYVPQPLSPSAPPGTGVKSGGARLPYPPIRPAPTAGPVVHRPRGDDGAFGGARLAGGRPRPPAAPFDYRQCTTDFG